MAGLPSICLVAKRMKIFFVSSFCLGLLVFASPLQAKKKKHSEPEPSPTPASTLAASPDDLPSKSLQPFLDAQLSAVLAPLDKSGFEKPEILVGLKAAYAGGAAVAPAARKPAYQAAQIVCDALTAAVTERENAVSALKGATATHSSEVENQPKGGRKAVRYETRNDDAFFSNTQRTNWAQRAALIRQNVVAIYLRERDFERQASVAAAQVSAAAPAPSAGTASPAQTAPAVPLAASKAGGGTTTPKNDDSD